MHRRFAVLALLLAPVLALVLAPTLAASAAASDTSHFVIRLGSDTVFVERVSREPDRVVVDQVTRTPRVMRRRFEYTYAGGDLRHFSMVVTPAGAKAPSQTIDASRTADSLVGTVQSGTAPMQRTAVALPPGTLVAPLSSLWSVYEGQLMVLARSKSDSVHGHVYFLGGSNAFEIGMRRLSADSVEIHTEAGDLYHARVDHDGHVLGVLPIHGTGRFSVERVASLDLDAFANAFAEREKAGSGVGVLSPRDTVRADVGGAHLWVDYGRPARRGRELFGNVVPYREVWRTGANAATQFKTDRALRFGDVEVPAGFYTLWSIPTEGGWTLLVNSETGQWGTEHKSEKDLYRIPMTSEVLTYPVERFTISFTPGNAGGMLVFDWWATRAKAAFTVVP